MGTVIFFLVAAALCQYWAIQVRQRHELDREMLAKQATTTAHPVVEIATKDAPVTIDVSDHAMQQYASLRSKRLAEHQEQMLELWRTSRNMSETAPLIPSTLIPDVDEQRWLAGLEGEQRFDRVLANALGSDWTLLRGVMTAKGEMDRLLVGPDGVFAFEIKNQSGNIHQEQDGWYRSRSGRKGQVWSDKIEDKGGRNPGRQLAEVANSLERRVQKAIPGLRLARIVMFAHPDVRVKKLQEPGVDAIVALDDFDPVLEKLRGMGQPLSRENIERIVGTVVGH